MTRRLLSVTPHTSLDLVDVETRAASVSLDGVVDATVDDDAPDRVTLAVEPNAVGTEEVPAHADRIRLSPEQARSLAADLTDHADRLADE